MSLPYITCLCPTYRRPSTLVANAIACFERQDYPAARRQLIVLDDAGELRPVIGPSWRIRSIAERCATLPAKYNTLVEMAAEHAPDVLAVWEDDDIYLPWHLSAVAEAIAKSEWAHPATVWSLYGGQLHRVPAAGRFHASLAIRPRALKAVGGWPATPEGNFDQQLMAALRRLAEPADPTATRPPGYVFRWGSTRSYHGQARMGRGDPSAWYRDMPQRVRSPGRDRAIQPKLDEESRGVIDHLVRRSPCTTNAISSSPG